jgi:hypothetical protein
MMSVRVHSIVTLPRLCDQPRLLHIQRKIDRWIDRRITGLADPLKKSEK